MDNTKSMLLEMIVEKLKRFSNIKNIILFGSYNSNSCTDDSDIDLCIIIDDNQIKETDWSVRNALFGLINRPLDLLIYNNLVFNERANSKTSFENQIQKQGQKLYG